MKCGNTRLPFVPFEILQFHTEDVFFVVGQHVDVFVAEPELLGGVSETVLVVVPVAIEVFPGIAEVGSTLDHLEMWLEMLDNSF